MSRAAAAEAEADLRRQLARAERETAELRGLAAGRPAAVRRSFLANEIGNIWPLFGCTGTNLRK